MRKCCMLLLGAIIAMGTVSAEAQVIEKALDTFKNAHPRAKFYGNQFYPHEGFFEDEMGTSTMIYGTTLSTGSSPIESASKLITEIRSVLGEEIGQLAQVARADGEALQGVMYDRATDTYKFSTFRFDQSFDGIPVFRAGVGFLVRNEPGNPVVMSTFDVKELKDLDFEAVGRAKAGVTPEMIENVKAMMGVQPVMRSVLKKARAFDLEIEDEETVIYAGANGIPASPELAVKFMATRGSVREDARNYQRYLIVASVATGEILLSESQVHEYVDVEGTVTGRATQGLGSLECDPEVEVPLPYIEANVVGGNSVFADENGQYLIPHSGSAQVTVRSRLRGQFFEVFDDTQGQAIPEVTSVGTPGNQIDLLHNPVPGQEFPTANVNAYLEANLVRDFTLFYAPNYPTIGSQNFFDIVVNENNFSGITSCNAVYTGNAMVFWRNGGGCSNTSFSDVVHHEYGHHLINVTGNGQGQLGEGSGDAMGVLIQDDPVLGNGFTGNCGGGIRNADNNLQYPCNGAIHTCGQLMSGCVWDLRNELIQTEPNDFRDINASLFINMLIVRGQMLPGNSTIDPQITIIYLELDDDDANIGNGTPHYAEIAAAFGAHNMDAPDLDLVEFEYPNGRPELVSPAGGVEFTVQVNPLLESPTPGTGVLWVFNGSVFRPFPMNEVTQNVYEAEFPVTECGSEVRYYFTVDANGQTEADPADAPDGVYTAISADSYDVVFTENFQTNTGWTVSGDATDGGWERGVPAGNGDRGDPSSDGDGSAVCFLTDNEAGNSDVDGGSTVLTSPILDASAGDDVDVLLSYLRWYSNIEGSNPESDTFVVEISNNGGATWTTVEIVGPTGAEVRGGWIKKTINVGDFVTPTDQVRLRFTASDLGGGSVVEAGVDGIEIAHVGCTPETTVAAESMLVELGTVDEGNLESTFESDDSFLTIIRRAGLVRSSPVLVRFETTLVSDVQATLNVEIESQASSIGVRQSVSMYDWNLNDYVQIDNRLIQTADNTVQIAVPNPENYIQPGTGLVRTRVGYKRSLLVVARGPWDVSIDQILWTE